MAESEEERKKKEEYIRRERQADEERRKEAGLESPVIKKYEPNKNDEPVIDESGSTHQKEQPKIDSGTSTHQAQQPKKPSRFETIRERFSESGRRLSDNFKKGARLTAEDIRESTSRKVRSKFNRLTPQEQKEELQKMKDRLAAMRTQEQIEKTKAKMRAANALANHSVFASNENEFFGMNMSGLNPEQFFGFGVSGNSQPEPSMGFSMEVWRQMTSYGSSKKSQSPMKDFGIGGDFDFDAYNKLFNSSWMGDSKKSIADYNIMNIGGHAKKSKPMTDDDIKRFYGMG